MSRLQFLVVEDESLIRKFLVNELANFGRVFEAESEEKANQILENIKPDMAFLDLNLTDTNKFEGLNLVQKCSENNIPSVVLTGHEEQVIVDEAYKRGAHHFYSKGDLAGLGGLDSSIKNFIKSLDSKPLEKFFEKEFITKNEVLKSKIKLLETQVLNFKQNILITGPSGSGKTKIAEYVHTLSKSKGELVSKNLTEISENLIESELFGHVKGAFTGANEDKVGLLEKANCGTLFLDEVGALPKAIQQKLLKVIEEKTFSPVGSNIVKKVEFNLISATCENLFEKIENGEFRLDFYFRIKGIEVELPALAERREDILPLLTHFLAQNKKKISISDDAKKVLQNYDWYGNVRELIAFSNELLSYSKGYIEVSDLPIYIQNNTNPLEKKEVASYSGYLSPKMWEHIEEHGMLDLIKKIEQEAFAESERRIGRKVNAISKMLNISKTMYYRIEEEYDSSKRILQ
ncbi:MAG: sigma-54-dependent Fis family transcriptional regulator [Oligoflexia bacterium]|nr:sigma-54-dependent Fis family transcriptional regulator [Oligoflexia bacterium]